jgi:hypothetical protein
MSSKLLSLDGQPVMVDQSSLTISTVAKVANRRYDYCFNLSGIALSRNFFEYIYKRIPNSLSSTVIAYSYAFDCYRDFSITTGYTSLNAEGFGAFVEWLKKEKSKYTHEEYFESTRRGYANFILKFMESLVEIDVVSARDADTARLRHQVAMRGSSARQVERMRQTAVSPEEYARITKVIRMEYEECKALLNQPARLQDEYDNVFPLLPFIMLLGADCAVRSAEFN